MGVSAVLQRVLVVEGFARVAGAAHGVVLAVVAHPPTHVPRGQVNGHVKVAGVGVAVAVALWRRTHDQDQP